MCIYTYIYVYIHVYIHICIFPKQRISCRVLCISSRQVSGSFAPKSVTQAVGPQTVGPQTLGPVKKQSKSMNVNQNQSQMIQNQ